MEAIIPTILRHSICCCTMAQSDILKSDLNRSFRFERKNFKQWKQKMLFFLMVKKLANFCVKEKLAIPKENPSEEQLKEGVDWEEKDFLCKNFILNGLMDDLYDYYSSMKIGKGNWDSLQKKYN